MKNLAPDFRVDHLNFNLLLERSNLMIKITILARRPRGLRAKINLASKEMSVFVVRLKMSRGK